MEEPDGCVKDYMVCSHGKPHEGGYPVWGFSHEPLPEFLAKFLDSAGLTEHGTTVVWSWLSKKGKAFLKAMGICIDEYCKVHNLNKEDVCKGPYGFSRFSASEWWTEDNVYVPEWVERTEQSLMTDTDVAENAIYRLFTGDKYGLYTIRSDDFSKKVDDMLQRIMKNKEGC